MMHRSTRRRHAVAAVVALTLMAALGSPALPAAGHDALLTSSPSADQLMPSPPTSLSMVFSAELMPDGAAVAVTDSSGEEWVSGAPVIAGAEVRAELAEGMPPGDFEVRWRVVSSDGHPISGVYTFSVDGSGQSRATPTQPTPAAEGPLPQGSEDNGTERSNWLNAPWLVGSTVALVLAGLVAIGLLRRRSLAGRGRRSTSGG